MREIPQKSYITVSKNGFGDYETIQEAINGVCDGNYAEAVIKISAGTYYEKITVGGDKTHITLMGEDLSNTIITFDDYAGKIQPNGDITGTFRSASIQVRANWFHAENLTIENSYDGSGEGGRQAVACYVSGEHDSFVNCRFIGRQDTLFVKEGSHYFKDCYIEGDTDFIFGGARAVFETCHIFSVYNKPVDPEHLPKGYICAPCTPCSQKYGFLFLDCITDGSFPDNTVFLGRPWHPGLDPYAIGNAIFMNCQLGKHINKLGWTNMGGYLCKNARLYEYGNRGEGAVVSETRRQLTEAEAEAIHVRKVLGWNPETERGGL